MSLFHDNEPMVAAAAAVRAALIKFDYVDGDSEPDAEDAAIALVAIRAWLEVSLRQSEKSLSAVLSVIPKGS